MVHRWSPRSESNTRRGGTSSLHCHYATRAFSHHQQMVGGVRVELTHFLFPKQEPFQLGHPPKSQLNFLIFHAAPDASRILQLPRLPDLRASLTHAHQSAKRFVPSLDGFNMHRLRALWTARDRQIERVRRLHLELAAGFEPATSPLPRECSTN